MRSRIIGTGSYVPERVLGNDELGPRLGVTPEWISERTGIHERHIAADDECTSDLAVKAARRALEAAGLSPEAVALIIVAPSPGDTPTPATASFVQAKLGAKRAFAFDLASACAGMLNALSVADHFVRQGTVRHALVIGAEIISRFLDWEDRNTAVIFGDAAGALVLAPSESEERGLLSTHLHTDGTLAEILWFPGMGSRFPASQAALDGRLAAVKMNGREVYRAAVRTLVSAGEEALAAHGLTPADIDLVIAHQANARILEAALDRIGMPLERCWLNIHRCANTAAASIPLCLDEAVRAGRLQPGARILMLATGAGFSWGSALVRW